MDESVETGESPYVFVLSQIGEEESPERRRADEVFELVIEPCAANAGLQALRADKDPTPGTITTQIVRHIVDAAVVIADLTGRNPNVYYELGVAHSFARPVILLVDDPTNLSFDTKNERTIPLGEGGQLLARQTQVAKTDLAKALAVVTSSNYDASNLVTEAASARSLDMLRPENPIATEIASMRSRLDELAQSVLHIANGSQREAWSQADIESAQALIQSLVGKGLVVDEEIAGLKTSATSARFDRWIERMRAAMNSPASEAHG
jgi:hypothetical protein